MTKTRWHRPPTPAEISTDNAGNDNDFDDDNNNQPRQLWWCQHRTPTPIFRQEYLKTWWLEWRQQLSTPTPAKISQGKDDLENDQQQWEDQTSWPSLLTTTMDDDTLKIIMMTTWQSTMMMMFAMLNHDDDNDIGRWWWQGRLGWWWRYDDGWYAMTTNDDIAIVKSNDDNDDVKLWQCLPNQVHWWWQQTMTNWRHVEWW